MKKIRDELLLTSPTQLKAVGGNTDTFSVNFKFAGPDGKPNGDTLPDEAVQRLEEWVKLARQEHEDIPTDLCFRYQMGDEQFEQTLYMRQHGSGVWSWLLYCDELRVSLGHGSLNGGVFCQVRFSSHLLWTLGAEQALVAIEAMLYTLLGSMLYQQASELHICLDVQGIDFSAWDWQHGFVSRVTSMRERPEVPIEGELEAGLSPTEIKHVENKIRQELTETQFHPIATTEHRKLATLDFGSHASAISAQIYNESREIKKHRKEWFEDIWRANGWDGQSPVWRIEFRFRRRFLADLEINEAFEALNNLEALWTYATTEWLRFVDLEASHDSNKSRLPTHPCWAFIQSAFAPLVNSETALGEQGEEEARINNMLEEKPLKVLQNAATLNLERRLFDESSLSPDDLAAFTEILHDRSRLLFPGRWYSWVLTMLLKPLSAQLTQEYRNIGESLKDESLVLVRDLAREELTTLPRARVSDLVALLSPEPFTVVRGKLVRRTRRMAKQKQCIAGAAGYMRSAVALAGDEIPIRAGHGSLPSLPLSMMWLCQKVEEYDREKGRVHMEEVFKKRRAYGFVSALELDEERRLDGVNLHKAEGSTFSLFFDEIKRREVRAAASDIESAR